MSPSKRSTVLGLFVCFLALSAGCSAIGGGDASETQLTLVNQDDENHAVVVEITDGGELVYSAGRTVESESDLDLAAFDGTGEYRVKTTVDGNSTVATHTFAGDDSVVTVGINNEGTVTIE
ncbi:MAG: hypothetical protein ABEJ40_08310 [Haloarculaceae archaeon]